MNRTDVLHAVALKTQRESNAELLGRIEAQQTQPNELIKPLAAAMQNKVAASGPSGVNQEMINQGVAHGTLPWLWPPQTWFPLQVQLLVLVSQFHHRCQFQHSQVVLRQGGSW